MEKVIVLENKYEDTLGNLRGMSGLKAAKQGSMIWLRGISAMDTDKRVLSVPAVHTYLLDRDDLLFPLNGRTPVAKLPLLEWLGLKSFLPIELTVAAMPGRVFLPLDVCLMRSEEPRDAFALLTDLATWKHYAETAPETRLRALRFAVSAGGEVLIIGLPLPQLPGLTFWANDSLLMPTGYDLEYPALASMVKNNLLPGADTLALFNADGAWQAIPLSAFKQARRSAVRLTQIAHDHS